MMRKTQKGQNVISLDVLLAATTLTRFGSESTDAFLQRVTHLHLQGKRINKLENMDSCTNVKVLYLYDNHIERIENLNFAANLQYLQLQNNMISEIPPLSMPSLTKLYLDDNRIPYLSGLEKCTSLEELHIANQTIPEQVSLQFDTSSLAAICRTLLTLEISGTGIEILAPFTVLRNLRRLFCANNRIVKIDEIKAMVALRHLSEATFKGNPCCASLRYRDHAISASSDSLLLLDDVPVPRHQQVAIKALMVHRRNISGVGAFNLGKFGDDQKSEASPMQEAKPLEMDRSRMDRASMMAGGTALKRRTSAFN